MQGVSSLVAGRHLGQRPKDLLYWLRCVVASLAAIFLSMLISAGVVLTLVVANIYQRSPDIFKSAHAFKHVIIQNFKKMGDASITVSDKAVAVMDHIHSDLEVTSGELQTTGKKALRVVQKTDRALFGQDADADSPLLSDYYGAHGIVGQVSGLLGVVRFSTTSLIEDLNALIGNEVTEGTIRNTLVQVRTNLVAIQGLTDSLNRAIVFSSPKAQELLMQLDVAVQHFDELIADPNVAKTLGNVEGISKTVDIAVLPLREKTKWLTKVLRTLIGLLRVNIL